MKESYAIELENKIYISVWNEMIDNKNYELLINKENFQDIIIVNVNDDNLVIENDPELLKKIIFKMTCNISIFME